MVATLEKGVRHHVRHWREQWDPEADLVFLRRFRLGLPGKQWAEPGDPVTPKIRKALGNKKLAAWWRARYVGREDHLIVPGNARVTPHQPAPQPKAEEPEEPILAVGGGWYQVTLKDGSVKKIRGKEKAAALLEA